MKNLILILLSVSFLLAGCAQTVVTTRIDDVENIPEVKYETYVYVSGQGGRLRAVFLKAPDADVEIVPYSLEIAKVESTFEGAMDFMESHRKHKMVRVDEVRYKGELIGYLLTHPVHSFQRVYIEVSLYERNGKIYFTVWESALSTDT
jgi:hypothetical protein